MRSLDRVLLSFGPTCFPYADDDSYRFLSLIATIALKRSYWPRSWAEVTSEGHSREQTSILPFRRPSDEKSGLPQ